MKGRHILHLLISTIVTAGLIWAILSEQSPGEFWQLLTKVDAAGVGLYLLISLFALALRTWRYQCILQAAARGGEGSWRVPSIGPLTVVTMIRNGLVDLLPARIGELGFLYVCKRYGVPLLSAGNTFVICLALDIVILAGLVLLFVLCSLLGGGGDSFAVTSGENQFLPALALATFAAVGGFCIYRLDRFIALVTKPALLVSRLSPLRRFARLQHLLENLPLQLEELQREVHALRRGRIYLKLVLLTVGLRIAKYGGAYIVLMAVLSQWGFAFGAIDPLLTTVAFISAEASSSLPFSGIMGFGAYEAAWTTIFSLSKVEIPAVPSVIFAVDIITQVVGYTLAIIAGAVFIFHEYHSD